MLRHRLIVALIFLPLFAWSIFASNVWPFYSLIWVGLILAVLELNKLLEHRGVRMHLPVVLPVVLAMGVMASVAPAGWTWSSLTLTLPNLLLIGFLAVCLLEVFRGETGTGFANMGAASFALLMLGGIGSFFPRMRQLPHGSWWFFLLFGFNWMYDAGAYFAGRFLGRTKLVPRISPGKTVEGMIGGLVSSAGFGLLSYWLWLPSGMGFSALGIAFLGVLLGCLAQAGDLVESMIKRWSGLKDSAGFIPGHGGVLDKIDSAFFTAPALYAVACWLMGL